MKINQARGGWKKSKQERNEYLAIENSTYCFGWLIGLIEAEDSFKIVGDNSVLSVGTGAFFSSSRSCAFANCLSKWHFPLHFFSGLSLFTQYVLAINA